MGKIRSKYTEVTEVTYICKRYRPTDSLLKELLPGNKYEIKIFKYTQKVDYYIMVDKNGNRVLLNIKKEIIDDYLHTIEEDREFKLNAILNS